MSIKSLNLSQADLIAIERELCSRSLAEFAKRAWHVLEPATPLKWGWALDAICLHLEAVTHGQINRLLMNVPPGPMRHDSLVETGRGIINLSDIKIGDTVLTHKGRYRRVEGVHNQGILPILKIITHSGRETYAAPTHPYLTPNGWIEAGKLKVGDILGVINRHEERDCPTPLSCEEARFLGYIVGDGAVTHAPSFVNSDPQIIDDFIHCARSLGMEVSKRRQKNHWIIGLKKSRKCLEKHNLLRKSSYSKRIPIAVMNSNTEVLRNFIGAYWSCDGGIDVRATRTRGSRYRSYATTVSETLAQDLILALGLIGIEARLRRKIRKLDTTIQPGGFYRSFVVEIQKESMTARLVNLPGMSQEKKSAGEYCRLDFQQPIWSDPIVSMEPQAPSECLCLTVEEDHSFTCSGIAVKNTMKSLLTGVIWPAWEWGPKNMPEMRFVGTAHEEQLAIRDSRRCRDLIKSGWFQTLWPIKLLADLDGKREFGNTRKGVRQARAFTSMTGTRSDRVLLDDPISADNANSPAKLEAARIAFTETLPTRVNSDQSAIVVIMQRLNEKDVSGVILDMELDYVHLRIPMRYEKEFHCRTAIGWEDPRTVEGELMFPERFSEKQVLELEKTLGTYGSAGQLQQRPAPRGGGIINIAWFKYWQTLPAMDFRFITADTAQKTATHNDFTVLQCWGRSTIGQAILIDQIRGRWEAPDLLIQSRAFWLKHINDPLPVCRKATLKAMNVEDKVSGTGLIQTLRREGIPVLAVQRNNDKISRCYDAAPFIESGNVVLPMDAPFLADFLAEIETFPAGAHDDQLDPLFDAIQLVQTTPAVTQANAAPMPTINRWS